MNTYTKGELDTFDFLQTEIEVSHGSKNSQTSSYCSLGVIFVSHRKAEVDQETIAKVLGDMSLKALNDLRTGGLIGAHHLPQVFRVQLIGQTSRIHQVTKHHRELPAFGVGRRWDGGCDLDLSTRGVLGRRLGSAGRRRWCQVAPTRPDEDAALFIHRQFFGVDQAVFEVFQGLVIELQPALEDPIGHMLLLLEECNDLGQDNVVVHHRPSTCASTASVWGNQKVMS